MQILQGHEGPVHALLFSPDGETLVSAGKDGTVRSWNAWGEPATLFVSSERVQALAFSADSQHLAVGGSEGALMAWKLGGSATPITRTVESPVSGLAFLPDNSGIAFSLGAPAKVTGVTAGSVRFWDWRENRIRALTADVAPTTAVRVLAALGPHRLMAWVTQNNILSVWPITRSSTTRFSLKAPCRSLAFSPDGKTLAATADWKVLIFDIERKHERFTLTGHKGMVGSLAYSPDGRHLLTGSWDKTVKIWDAANGRELTSFDWPVGRVGAVAYAPDGLRAAAAGDEGPIVIWDVDG
jgi:WD40 repeat protein